MWMKSIIKISFIFLGCMVFFLLYSPTINLFAQEPGYKFYRNYSKDDYDHSPQNWCITQDQNGLIYSGNTGGVLIYDGVSWRLIWIPNLLARAITIAKDNTVFVGGKDELGYLSYTQKGNLEYLSLLKHLDKNSLNFDSIRRAFSTHDSVYFISQYYLFRWDYKQFHTWKSKTEFLSMHLLNETLYIQSKDIGLQKLENNEFQNIPNGSLFSDDNKKIIMLVPFDSSSQTFLIATRSAVLYLFNNSVVKPFRTEADPFLKDRKLLHGLKLSSGEFALATDGAGILIINRSGKLVHHYNSSSGLLDDNVKYIYQEPGGNIWLALNNGISKIEYQSPFTIYDKRSNLPGMILCMMKHPPSGAYYVGSTEGLFTFLPSSSIQRVDSLSGQCWSLAQFNGSILAATDNGVFSITNNKPSKIAPESLLVIIPSKKNPNRFWGGYGKGLLSLIYNPNNRKWTTSQLKGISIQINSIAEDPNGSLWLGTLNKGVYFVLNPLSSFPLVTDYNSKDGLPPEKNKTMGEINISTIDGQTVFATQQGLFRFDKSKNRFISIPIYDKNYSRINGPIFRIAQDTDGHIWFHSKSVNYLASLQPDQSYLVDDISLLRIPIIQTNFILPETQYTWFCTNDNLIRFDRNFQSTQKKQLKLLIRRVENILDKNVLFDGQPPTYFPASGKPIPEYPYQSRNIRFFLPRHFSRMNPGTIILFFSKDLI